MKKIISIIIIILLIPVMRVTVFADTSQNNTEYTLVCTNGVCLSDDAAVYKDSYYKLYGKSFATSDTASAHLLFDGVCIDIAANTRMSAGDDVILKEGAIRIKCSDGAVIQTPTEKAFLSNDSVAVIRVDDYGNAFNYCIEGTLRLVCIDDNNEITLGKGEYIAVTVKRGIRELRGFEESETEEMNIPVSDSSDDLLSGKEEATLIRQIEFDFSENKDICNIKTNNAYKLVNMSEKAVSQVLYIECDLNAAVLEVYDSDFKLIGKSSGASGAIMPNVHIAGEPESVFYLYISSANNAEYTLLNERYISIYEKSFNLLKKLLLPAAAALVVFVIYAVIRDKKTSKKPKF